MIGLTRLRPPLWLRAVGAAALAFWGAYYLAHQYHQIRPLGDWLVFDLAKMWLWDLFLTAACASFGHAVVKRVLGASAAGLTRLESLAFALPVGLVSFVLLMYLGGFLHLFGPVFAVLMPAGMLAVGLAPRFQVVAELRAAAGNVRGLSLAAWTFGVLALGVLYIGLLSPHAVNYDARWNHLVVAQDYAREGHIVPFRADWVRNLPHLGSIVNAWAFMLPGLPLLALRAMMSLHNEFTVLCWTLVGVAATARWLSERDVAGSWAALFLFPGIFVYDGNLGGSADHFVAVFAAPVFLASARATQRFEPRWCVLAGLLAGGGFLTKVHLVYLVGPIALYALGRAAWLVVRRRRGDTDAPPPREIARGAGLAGAATLAVMLPFLVSHVVFFRNPVYPLMQNVFTASSPGIADATFQMNYLFRDWHFHPPTALGERLLEAFKMIFTFSFLPHYSWFNNLPVFGSLFTLFLPVLPLVGTRRLWLGALVCMGTLFTWAFTYWVDRNLQVFMPLFAAVTAAMVIRAWGLGLIARAGVVALIAVQLAWGISLYFTGSDPDGTDRIASAMTLLRNSTQANGRQQIAGFQRSYVDVGASLPTNAVVLLHNWHLSLGIDRPVLLDWIGMQGLIDYRTFRTPRELYDRFRAVGATHVVRLAAPRIAASRQEQILFDVFADVYGTDKQRFGELEVFPMPPPPPAEAPYQVLVVGVSQYRPGLYPIQSLSVCEEFPPDLRLFPAPAETAPAPFSLIDRADVVLITAGMGVDPETTARLNAEFRWIRTAGNLKMWLHRR